MPLKSGGGKKNFDYNVKELAATGRPMKQDLAIAYKQLRGKKKPKRPA